MNATIFMLWICCGDSGVHIDISDYQNPLSPTGAAVYYIAGFLCLIIGLLTIAVNTFFLISIKGEPALQTSALKLLVVLALVDILQGLTSWPMYGIYLLKMTHANLDCLINRIMLVFGFGLGFMNVSAIFVVVLSQYLSIIFPIQFRNGVSVVMLLLPLFIINTMSILSGIISLFVVDYFQFQKLVLAVLTATLLVLMCFFYVHLSIEVGKSRRKTIPADLSNGMKKRLMTRNQNFKLVKTAMIILCSFIACYAPLIILFALLGKPSTFATLYLEIFFNIIALCNSFLDYFVYHWRIKNVRLAVKRMVRKIISKLRSRSRELQNAEPTTTSGAFQITNE